MQKIYKDISGVILAGGQSRRMGFPKNYLTINGKSIIDNTIELLETFFDELIIVTDVKSRCKDFGRVKVVEDLVRECGPLGGIYTGLKLISCKKAFFVANDMPFLYAGLIERVLKTAKDEKIDCVVPYSYKGFEPLHALYSKNILPGIKNALKRKEFTVIGALTGYKCKFLKARIDELSSFYNINTPDDLQKINIHEREIQGL